MTTIAYHHESKTIAWDSRTTEGGIIKNDSAVKVIKRDGVTFWLSGCRSDHEMLIDAWFGNKSSVIPESQAIVLDDGKFYGCAVNEERIFWREELDANEAIGSGRYWAMAAMDFGKTPKQAVEYAKTRDCYTGGDVHEFCLPAKSKEQMVKVSDVRNSALSLLGICQHGRDAYCCAICDELASSPAGKSGEQKQTTSRIKAAMERLHKSRKR